jgi:hypothetical protein
MDTKLIFSRKYFHFPEKHLQISTKKDTKLRKIPDYFLQPFHSVSLCIKPPQEIAIKKCTEPSPALPGFYKISQLYKSAAASRIGKPQRSIV